ncbi:MAG: Gfo/Idh/MocA family protein [Acidimicrobiales bacterium]
MTTAANGPVRLGVVGLGWWGKVLADAAGRSGVVDVVACFARTEASRERFAAEVGCRPASSLPELLTADDIEGVLFATPNTTHLGQIREAAAAGRHVFVEKPLALTVAEAQQAVVAAEAAGVVLMVGHQRRRQAPNRRIRQLLDDGSLGTPLLAEASFTTSSGYPPTWRASRDETPLGAMTGLGVHMVDTFHYLLGPVSRVSAFSKQAIDGEPLDHATGLLLEFLSGAVGTLLCSHFAPPASRIAVHGTGGAAANVQDGARLMVQRAGESTLREVDVASTDPVVEQLAEFAAAIRGDGKVETGGHEALAVVAVMEAAIASARTGVAVTIPADPTGS